ncbi:MAG: hypothetical protein GQ544_05015, partial [Candidatus Aminicenantes bacterium]|nr:hypothetical protein [Candidatus Aminicenantes bacterium]
IKFKYISGGNCTSYHLIEKGTWPEGVNRVVSNLYILKAEIIEANRKPTVPFGELGLDTFMKSKLLLTGENVNVPF